MFTCTAGFRNGKSILTVHGKNLSHETVARLFGTGVDVVSGITNEDIRMMGEDFDIVDIKPAAAGHL